MQQFWMCIWVKKGLEDKLGGVGRSGHLARSLFRGSCAGRKHDAAFSVSGTACVSGIPSSLLMSCSCQLSWHETPDRWRKYLQFMTCLYESLCCNPRLNQDMYSNYVLLPYIRFKNKHWWYIKSGHFQFYDGKYATQFDHNKI